MSSVSDDASWLALVDAYRVYGYFIAASSVVVLYDWALTFGQEIDLVWVSSIPITRATGQYN
jgi:hypothetical protein